MDTPKQDAAPTQPDDSPVVWPLANLGNLPDATLVRLLMRCAAEVRARGMPLDDITSTVQTKKDGAGAARMARALMRGGPNETR